MLGRYAHPGDIVPQGECAECSRPIYLSRDGRWRSCAPCFSGAGHVLLTMAEHEARALREGMPGIERKNPDAGDRRRAAIRVLLREDRKRNDALAEAEAKRIAAEIEAQGLTVRPLLRGKRYKP